MPPIGIFLAMGGRRGGGGAFSPLDISGLALWLDPSDATSITLDGSSKVSQIDDKSGNARHYTNGTATERPTVSAGGLNSLDALSFAPANSEKLLGPSFSALTAAEAFIITKKTAGTGGTTGGLWWFGSPVDAGYYPFASGVEVYDSFGSTTRRALGGVGSSTFLESTRCYESISTSSEYTATFDGAQQFTTATNTVGWNGTQSIIGRNGSTGATHFNGLIGEALIYDHKLPTSDRTAIRDYLTRWGVTFP